VGLIAFGCKKAAPTAFMRGLSMYYATPEGTYTWHSLGIEAVSPNYTPQVNINGYVVPKENISEGFANYSIDDTLPKVSPNTDLQVKVTYYDLNDSKKEASANIKLAPEPAGFSLSITSGQVNVAWAQVDPKAVSFIGVFVDASCLDADYNYQYAQWDTILTDVQEATSISLTLGTLCDEIGDPVAARVEAAVMNGVGPWSGAKDNLKGIVGQYYGGTIRSDTASWVASTTYTLPEYPNLDINSLLRRVKGLLGEW